MIQNLKGIYIYIYISKFSHPHIKQKNYIQTLLGPKPKAQQNHYSKVKKKKLNK